MNRSIFFLSLATPALLLTKYAPRMYKGSAGASSCKLTSSPGGNSRVSMSYGTKLDMCSSHSSSICVLILSFSPSFLLLLSNLEAIYSASIWDISLSSDICFISSGVMSLSCSRLLLLCLCAEANGVLDMISNMLKSMIKFNFIFDFEYLKLI